MSFCIKILRSLFFCTILFIPVSETLAQTSIDELLDAIMEREEVKIRQLIEKEGLVNEKNQNHITPLMIAAEIGDKATVELLLQNGADVNSYSEYGGTALIQSVIAENLEISELLLKYKADPLIKAFDNQTALHFAIENNDSVMTEMLLDYGADLSSNIFGDNELIIATINNYIPTIHLLIKYGFHLDFRNKNGKTALIIATENNNTEIAKLLLKNGANTDIRDQYNMNAISYAIKNRNNNIVELIIAADADLSDTGVDDTDLITLAELHGNKHIIELLKNKGVKKSRKFILYKATIECPFLISKKDFMTGLEAGLYEWNTNTSAKFGFMSRPARSKVLIMDKKTVYSQYRERRTSFYLSLEKEFTLYKKNYSRAAIFFTAKSYYSLANYRGIDQKAPIQLKFSPLAGFLWEEDIAGFRAGYEYCDWGYENMSPHKIILSVFVNLKTM